MAIAVLAAAVAWPSSIVGQTADGKLEPSRAPAWFPCQGASITRLLLHFDATLVGDFGPAWRDLAHGLAPDVQVTIACSLARDVWSAVQFASACGFDRRRLDTVCVGRPVSLWSRDASLVLDEVAVTVLGLRGRADAERLGDLCASRLVAAQVLGATAVTAPIDLDGGQVVFGERCAFLGGRAVAAGGAELLRQRLQALGSTRLCWVEAGLAAPHPHLDMYFAAIDDETVLVGEASARDATEAFRCQCEAVAGTLRARGLTVARLPIVPLEGGRLLTWTNVLTETRDGPVAYVPRYGVWQDAVAYAAWQERGFRVVPVDCSRLVVWGGAVRCLTNVLRWRPTRLHGKPLTRAAAAASAIDHTPRCDPHPAGAAR